MHQCRPHHQQASCQHGGSSCPVDGKQHRKARGWQIHRQRGQMGKGRGVTSLFSAAMFSWPLAWGVHGGLHAWPVHAVARICLNNQTHWASLCGASQLDPADTASLLSSTPLLRITPRGWYQRHPSNLPHLVLLCLTICLLLTAPCCWSCFLFLGSLALIPPRPHTAAQRPPAGCLGWGLAYWQLKGLCN